MKEVFITYLWKHRMLRGHPMKTVEGKTLEIISPGQENTDAGPDFLAAVVRIGETVWAGNVEIHVRSSQWFAHGHHKDKAYANIILHVVYCFDKAVKGTEGQNIPHLEVREYFDPDLEKRYSFLVKSRRWIACETLLPGLDPFLLNHWLYRLLISRMERKSGEIQQYLDYFDQHREKTFLFLLGRALGGKINATAFGLLLQRTPYEILLKNHDMLFVLEALLYGQAGMLNRSFSENYPNALKQEYAYQKKKYKLPQSMQYEIWKYARMRPYNFPDLRIAQLAGIIHNNNGQIYRKVMASGSAGKVEKVLESEASNYWSTHYRFNKPAKSMTKAIGKTALQNIIINTVIPFMFDDAQKGGNGNSSHIALSMLEGLPPEDNNIIRKWQTIIPKPESAAITQGLLELKKFYCLPKKCLQCMPGHHILGGKAKSGIDTKVSLS